MNKRRHRDAVLRRRPWRHRNQGADTSSLDTDHPGRRVAVLAGVVVVAFLAGWSADGPTAGIVMAVALGAGCASPVLGARRAGLTSEADGRPGQPGPGRRARGR